MGAWSLKPEVAEAHSHPAGPRPQGPGAAATRRKLRLGVVKCGPAPGPTFSAGPQFPLLPGCRVSESWGTAASRVERGAWGRGCRAVCRLQAGRPGPTSSRVALGTRCSFVSLCGPSRRRREKLCLGLDPPLLLPNCWEKLGGGARLEPILSYSSVKWESQWSLSSNSLARIKCTLNVW